jgi:hypothetical protein
MSGEDASGRNLPEMLFKDCKRQNPIRQTQTPVKLPFSPRRTFVLRVLTPGLSLLCPLALLFLTLFSPPRPKDWIGFGCSWLVVLLVSFFLWLATQEKLSFDEEGIERVSGLRRHRTLYTDVQSIKMKLRPSRNGQVPVILIGTSPRRAPTEICLFNYETGEGRKMLNLLSQHTPSAIWNEMARDFLHSP